MNCPNNHINVDSAKFCQVCGVAIVARIDTVAGNPPGETKHVPSISVLLISLGVFLLSFTPAFWYSVIWSGNHQTYTGFGSGDVPDTCAVLVGIGGLVLGSGVLMSYRAFASQLKVLPFILTSTGLAVFSIANFWVAYSWWDYYFPLGTGNAYLLQMAGIVVVAIGIISLLISKKTKTS